MPFDGQRMKCTYVVVITQSLLIRVCCVLHVIFVLLLLPIEIFQQTHIAALKRDANASI